jgi:hypothetical protein
MPYFEYAAAGDINTPAAGDVYTSSGARIAGYFYPPTTGDYTFFISSDDNGSLYLSTDDSPANKKLIAVEGAWSNPRSYTAAGAAPSTVENKNSSTYTAAHSPRHPISTQWHPLDARVTFFPRSPCKYLNLNPAVEKTLRRRRV